MITDYTVPLLSLAIHVFSFSSDTYYKRMKLIEISFLMFFPLPPFCLARFKFARFDSLSRATQADLSIENGLTSNRTFQLAICDYWSHYVKRKNVCCKLKFIVHVHVQRLEDNYFRIISNKKWSARSLRFYFHRFKRVEKWKILSNVEESAFDISTINFLFLKLKMKSGGIDNS